MVWRLIGRSGAAWGAGISGDCSRSRGSLFHLVFHREHEYGIGVLRKVSEGHRRQNLHLRIKRINIGGASCPRFFVREAFEKTPDDIFKRVGFSGDHSKTLALVQSGSYEVGAMNYKVWRKEVEAGKVDPMKVQVIWRTPPYPDYNWTIRGDADEAFGDGFIKKVQQAITDIDDPAILDAFPRKSFIPADNSLYQPILDTAIEVGIIRK